MIKMSAVLVENKLGDAAKVVDGALDLVLDAGAAKITEAAKRLAVDQNIIDTGTLLANIDYGPAGKRGREVVSAVDYAAVPEFGLHGQAARPYMMPAFDMEAPNILHAAEQITRDELRGL